jgi:type I restriction enzyme, S subunit
MKYKKSSISWETFIPTHWEEIKGKYIFTNEKEIIGDDWMSQQRISLTYDGVVPRDNDDSNGLNPDSLSTYQVVKENDLLFKLIDLENKKTSRVGLSAYNGITSSAYIRVNVNNMHPKYYFYWFYSLWFRYIYNRLGNGVRSTLNSKDLLNLLVPVPPKEEQIKISETIDNSISKINQLITNQQQQIEKLKDYKKSIISFYFDKYVFDRQEHKDLISKTALPLNHLTNIIRGNSAFKKDELLSEGVFIGLQYGKTYKTEIVDSSYNHFVDSKFFKEDQTVFKDDVILISTSETVEDLGHTCFYNREEIGLLGGEQFVLKPIKDKINGKFLYYCTLEVSKYIKKYCTGLKVYRFNSTHLKNIYINLPGLDEQQKVVHLLDKKINEINSLLRLKQTKIIKLEEYKKSLIYEYVTGKKEVS